MRNLSATLNPADVQAVYRYRLPLQQPIQLAGQPHAVREGLVIQANIDGQVRLGEIAPLPGFSRESLSDAQAELIRWCEGAAQMALSPSVAFGLSMLAFEPEGRPAKATCRLFTELDAPAMRRFPKGQVVKCKVARGEWQDEAEQIKQLLQHNPSICLRLDANQQWDLDTAIAFAERVNHRAIRFIEEPCRTLDETQLFAQHGLLPVALDETLQQPEWPELIFSGLAALVVKPMLIGDLKRVMMLANLAQFSDLELVISGAYESSLGNHYLQQLAGMLAPDTAPGLDTLSAFKEDLIVPRHAFDGAAPVLNRLDTMEPVWMP